jgi:GGDEF domain-containing protein
MLSDRLSQAMAVSKPSGACGALMYLDLCSQIDIMKWADAAMYQTKDAGRNTIRSYDLIN